MIIEGASAAFSVAATHVVVLDATLSAVEAQRTFCMQPRLPTAISGPANFGFRAELFPALFAPLCALVLLTPLLPEGYARRPKGMG